MDSDGFSITSRRRGRSAQESVRDRNYESYYREVQRYEGPSEDYDRMHKHQYGREVDLGPNGEHPKDTYHFPPGTDRSVTYDRYQVSTVAMNNAKHTYKRELRTATNEVRKMSKPEKAYYQQYGHLAPHHHEHLNPLSQQYRDKSYTTATTRETFLKAHPYGYHAKMDQNDHHDWCSGDFEQHEYASSQQKMHAQHRSYQHMDSRKDQWGRPDNTDIHITFHIPSSCSKDGSFHRTLAIKGIITRGWETAT